MNKILENKLRAMIRTEIKSVMLNESSWNTGKLNKFMHEIQGELVGMDYSMKYDMAQSLLDDEDGLEDFIKSTGVRSPIEYLASRI